jgi:hypothetical protein
VSTGWLSTDKKEALLENFEEIKTMNRPANTTPARTFPPRAWIRSVLSQKGDWIVGKLLAYYGPATGKQEQRDEYLSVSEHEAIKSAAVAEARRSAIKEFSLWGTDECLDCDEGRATLYATLNGRCIACFHKSEREGGKNG